VSESWREALRLLVADCKDDDVDEVLLSILNPLQGEDEAKTGRPRAVLAALCLADEPNVSEGPHGGCWAHSRTRSAAGMARVAPHLMRPQSKLEGARGRSALRKA